MQYAEGNSALLCKYFTIIESSIILCSPFRPLSPRHRLAEPLLLHFANEFDYALSNQRPRLMFVSIECTGTFSLQLHILYISLHSASERTLKMHSELENNYFNHKNNVRTLDLVELIGKFDLKVKTRTNTNIPEMCGCLHGGRWSDGPAECPAPIEMMRFFGVDGFRGQTVNQTHTDAFERISIIHVWQSNNVGTQNH